MYFFIPQSYLFVFSVPNTKRIALKYKRKSRQEIKFNEYKQFARNARKNYIEVSVYK